MKRTAVMLATAACLAVILNTHEAKTSGIANVTLPFGGTITDPEDTRALVAGRMKALISDAAGAGVSAIDLQSVAYTLTPANGGYEVQGNLFITVVPESHTAEFVAALGKKGANAVINYYQACRPR